MLPDPISERFLVGVEAGQYALLLGAGFSMAASSKNRDHDGRGESPVPDYSFGAENDAFAAHQAEEMVAWIDSGGSADVPVVILGDFSSRPGNDAMSQYENAGFVYVRDSDEQILDEIDHIMYRPRDRWRLLKAGKPTHYTASDHDPVWASLELLSPPPTP